MKNIEFTSFSNEYLIDVLNEVNISSFLDQFGPEIVNQIYDPEKNIYGILVIDNTALGPGIAPLSLFENITPKNAFILARDMTYQCALAEVPFGGAFVGVKVNPFITKADCYKSFLRKISPFIPERLVLSEEFMINLQKKDNFSILLNKNDNLIDITEKKDDLNYNLGLTAYGVGIVIQNSLNLLRDNLNLIESIENTKIGIIGWNDLSFAVAEFLYSKGLIIISITDRWTTIQNEAGFNPEELKKYVNALNEEFSLINYRNEETVFLKRNLNLNVDILVLTDSSQIITKNNFDHIHPKLIIEATLNKIKQEIEQKLFENGIWVIPNSAVLCGEIISTYSKIAGVDRAETFSVVESKCKKITDEIILSSIRADLLPRYVAKDIAQGRIIEAMENKR